MRLKLLGGLAVALVIILVISILPIQQPALQSSERLGGRLSESVEKAQLLLLETPAKLYVKENDPFESIYVIWFTVATRIRPLSPVSSYDGVILVDRLSPAPNYFQRLVDVVDGPLGTKEIKYYVVFRYDAGFTGTVYIINTFYGAGSAVSTQNAFSIPTQTYNAGVNYRWMFYAPSVQYTSASHNFTGQLFYWNPSLPLVPFGSNVWRYNLNWYFLDSMGAQITLSPSYDAAYEWSATQLNITIRITITSTSDIGKNISKIRMYITDPQNNAFLYNAIILDLASPFIVQGVGDTIVIKVVYNLYPYNY